MATPKRRRQNGGAKTASPNNTLPNILPGSNFQFCTQEIVIYIFSTDQKSKIFFSAYKNSITQVWSNQGALHVSCHSKAFFLATL